MSRLLAPVSGFVALGGVVLAATATGAVAAPSITASARPEAPLFGDPFRYLVVVKAPAADAGRLRIVDDVGAFARVAPRRTARSTSNGAVTSTVTETLACLAAACMSSSPDGRSVTLPPARVVLDGARTTAIPVIVRVGTRVPASEVTADEPPFRWPHDLPAVGYRVSPGALEAALVVGGLALLGAAALGIAVPLVRRRVERARASAAPDPIARAVRLLRESVARDATDRRRAAGLASRVVDRPELSLEAATVAWSRPEPGSSDATMLADRVEREEAPA